MYTSSDLFSSLCLGIFALLPGRRIPTDLLRPLSSATRAVEEGAPRPERGDSGHRG